MFLPPFRSFFVFFRRICMEAELLGIVLGAVLPIYPMLFVIYQKIGRYDEVVEEFKKLRAEHESLRENWHGN
jgi:predicted membrane protein